MQLFEKNSSFGIARGFMLLALASISLTGWLIAIVFITFMVLTGCTHKKEGNVTATKSEMSVRRTDQFQAAATNQKKAVVVGGNIIILLDLQSNDRSRITLSGSPALIDVTSCADGSFAALDFYRKVWVADSNAANWKPQNISGDWRPLALTCDSQNRIWVVGSFSTIASSADHGASWQTTDFKEDAMFNTVQFLDDKNGFITGEFGAVYRTTDGGVTWQAENKIPGDFYPYSALFTNATDGYITGLTGVILATKDAGKTWDKLENPIALPQFGLAKQGGAVYSVGMNGSLLKLQNQQWQAVKHDAETAPYLRAVLPLGADRLLIAGASGALHIVQLAGVDKSASVDKLAATNKKARIAL
jgi:photosystem II stability/assembly factor-like uncharacterized protein